MTLPIISNGKPPGCSGCLLAPSSRGFALDSGDPLKARIAFVLEAPTQAEVAYGLRPMMKRSFLATQVACDAELKLRREAYPELEPKYLMSGVPSVAGAGAMLDAWVFRPLGLKREECFISQTIRCTPPRGKTGKAYPIGDVRTQAESACRQWDRLPQFLSNASQGAVAVCTILPSDLMAQVTPLPLLIADIRKAMEFAATGLKVVVLMGGKAAETYLGYGSNAARWRGHYQFIDAAWYERTLARLANRAAGIKPEGARRKVSGRKLWAAMDWEAGAVREAPVKVKKARKPRKPKEQGDVTGGAAVTSKRTRKKRGESTGLAGDTGVEGGAGATSEAKGA